MGPRTGPAGVSPGTRPSASCGARRAGLSAFARAGSCSTGRRTGQAPTRWRCGRRSRSRARRRSSPGSRAARPSAGLRSGLTTPAASRYRDHEMRPAAARKLIAEARLQHRFQLTHLAGTQLALGTTRALGSQRPPATPGQRPPPPIHRHPRHPEMPGDLPITDPASIRSAAATGPAPGGHAQLQSARHHRDTSHNRHTAPRARRHQTITPQLKIS